MAEKLETRELIGKKVAQEEGFLLGIIRCKNRNEVFDYLSKNGINVTEGDVDYLAENIREIADICLSMSDEELEKVVGGGNEEKKKNLPEGVDEGTYNKWDKGLKITGIGLLSLGGLGLLTVIASDIRALGKKKGWWN